MNYFDIHYVISFATEYINPVNAIIAAGVMLLAGIGVFAGRHKISKERAKKVA